ncbi:hypothetical protein PNQ69_20695 [Xanthomonas sp. A2111]|uniref:Uncharacterized protein n=1 Tax=Xanthomonas hawaiiensis TaxID=3003247 RepID=A0ABU2IAL8_9XANT|nr:hypothetical protein [Xanthomonas sp. A2111]MDS9995184.1 hypothetical protein [Xanthomonas sp. A2111]
MDAAKYKKVANKVRPINEPLPAELNPPLRRQRLSRDPYESPLVKNPPEFSETSRITFERLGVVNFGPDGWLSGEEKKLLLDVMVKREKAIAFVEEERGVLKHSYGEPYKIPVVCHEPWQNQTYSDSSCIKREDFVKLSENGYALDCMSNQHQVILVRYFVSRNRMASLELFMILGN